MSDQARIWNRDDPFLPLDWRWRQATAIVEQRRLSKKRKKRPKECPDRWVQLAVDYLESLENTGAVSRLTNNISAALDLANRDDPLTWEIESHILAGETDDKIGRRTGIPADAVECYAALFFDVRDNLTATDWLASQTGAVKQGRGFQNGEVCEFWSWVAMHAGPVVLDYMIAVLDAVCGPNETPTLDHYLRPGVPLELQAFVAVHAIPPSRRERGWWEMLHVSWIEVQGIQQPVRRANANQEVMRQVVECGRLTLAGKPLPPLPDRKPQTMKRRSRRERNVARADQDYELIESVKSGSKLLAVETTG